MRDQMDTIQSRIDQDYESWMADEMMLMEMDEDQKTTAEVA